MKEAEKFNLILEYDGELREKIEIQKKFNSYSLNLKTIIKDSTHQYLIHGLKLKKLQKNEEILAEVTLKDKSLFLK